ncbi:Tannase/feruloyl esterase [Xylariales sp. AK1849]|nr:Tannase/feruloyl esterase [Xylariales sp. AK1849]
MSELEVVLRELTKDARIRVLHTQKFCAGDALVPNSGTPWDGSPRIANEVHLVKLFMRTTDTAPEAPHPTAGTDVGIELWLPEPAAWNRRLRVQIQGGFMGDAGITATDKFAASPCGTELPMGQIASDLGYVVASTDGGHVASTYEDTSYLLNDNGSVNIEGFKNIAWQATLQTARISKEILRGFYGEREKSSYLYGCSTGGRQAYHSAQRFPEDFDGFLIGCPSITQSLLFPSLIHPQIVIHNDLGGECFKPGQLEMVSRKALEAGDTSVTSCHDGYITHWDRNHYDPTKDPSMLCIESGGECSEPWALTLAQAKAINKIWYGPTMDGSIPDPEDDNGAGWHLAPNQLWWGKIRGTRIDYAGQPRHIGGGWLANAHADPTLASPLWDHALGKGQNKWQTFTHEEFAQAMLKCKAMDPHFQSMDADDPDLRKAQQLGRKILTYHAIADTGVAPQSAIRYYESSAALTGGIETTQCFHRLFLIPGMGHCIRYRGVAGYVDPPLPTIEAMFESLVTWVELGKAPEYLQATSVDGSRSRNVPVYPVTPRYKGGDVNDAGSFEP